MSKERRKRPTFLICEHCGKANNVQNGALETISKNKHSPAPDTIKRALKRIGMYPNKKNGEKAWQKQLDQAKQKEEDYKTMLEIC